MIQIHLDGSQLKELQGSEGKSLGDEVALVISQVGENISLRRATCLNVTDNLLVTGSTHPSFSKISSVIMGKYGSLLVYKTDSNEKNIPDIARQLCQHVIGN